MVDKSADGQCPLQQPPLEVAYIYIYWNVILTKYSPNTFCWVFFISKETVNVMATSSNVNVNIPLVMVSLYRVCKAGWACSCIAATRCHFQIILGQAARTQAWYTLTLHRYSAFPHRIFKIQLLFSLGMGRDSRAHKTHHLQWLEK